MIPGSHPQHSRNDVELRFAVETMNRVRLDECFEEGSSRITSRALVTQPTGFVYLRLPQGRVLALRSSTAVDMKCSAKGRRTGGVYLKVRTYPTADNL